MIFSDPGERKEDESAVSSIDYRKAMEAAEASLVHAREDGMDKETIEIFESIVERYRRLIRGGAGSNRSDS